MAGTSPTRPTPAVGYVLIGGGLVGSQVRDIRLANELARRGCRGHVWWAMDRPKEAGLDPEITQDWLFNSVRNAAHLHGPTMERVGKVVSAVLNDRRREELLQKHSWFLSRQMVHLIQRVCDGVDGDPGLIRRFARQIDRSGVDYLLPNIEVFSPYVAAALRQAKSTARYSVTFQGYEVYSRYAREIGLEQKLFMRFREAVEESGSPAVVVSNDYRNRVHADIGIPLDQIVVIPPGIPEMESIPETGVHELVSAALPGFDPQIPLISYVGRQDPEKGIDLMLYAARMLRTSGLKFQMAVCGASAFGGEYATVLRNIADQLAIPLLWHGRMSVELRTAIYQASRCTIYPSIHREPFGMVPVESMMLGTPAIVADTGGVAELVQGDGIQGGLTFRSWDSADLAAKIRTLIEDDALYASLAAASREVASRYSVRQLGDKTLELIETHRS